MAVHTELSKANINQILENYNLGQLKDYRGIKEGIENTNYSIVTTTNKYIITIFERRVDTSQIPFFFEIMHNSNTSGIECPVPIKNKTGKYVSKIKNKKMAIFLFLEGSSKNEWSIENCFDVGKKLAKFHLANKYNKLSSVNNFSKGFWQQFFLNNKNKLNDVIPNCFEIIRKEIDFISLKWPENLPKGIIHADLFPDNVFFKDNKISGFLDFYFSCNDFFSYDLAITVNAWCFKDNKFNKKFFISLISGYQSIRKLEKLEKDNFNVLLRGASLRFLFTRIHDQITGIENKFLNKKDPKEFYKILYFHINKPQELYFE